MTEITLDQARAIIDAALQAAAARGLATASVVVTDPGGFVRASARSDAAPPYGIKVATAKARTAAGFRRSSQAIGALFGERPGVVTGLTAAVGGSFLVLGGGVGARNADGAFVGAVAFAGGAPDIDHAIAVQSITEAGLTAVE